MMLSGVLTEIYKDVRGSIKNKREKAEAEKAEIENASYQYEKKYRDRHGQIKVFCVGMREPLSLDDVYVAVQFLDDQSTSRYGSPEDVEKAFRQRYPNRPVSSADKRQDATEIANEKQYLMLLGGPGVGKSTFLRKVGLEALKGDNGNFEHACIPVFLQLKVFTAEQINIEALITEEFRTCGYPDPEQMTETALKLGKLLILFDGLDEVPAANVDNVVNKIGDFVDRYSQNRFIASCRIAAYKGGFRRFTDVEMAEFDEAQIEAYIKNWFDSTPHQYRHQLDKEMKTAEKCWRALNSIGHHATKELARNPLLLTLLCLVYDNSQNFPRNRADIYEKALSIFLEEWAAEKRVRRQESISQYLDIAAEKRMLSEIAAKNFEENRLFFSEDELIDQIQKFGEGDANTPPTFNASKILETILVDQGLFVEQVSDSYSFSHLTFQEYLTANYIVRDTRSIQGLVSKHLHNEQWREIFLLTAGRMHAADDLLRAMELEAFKCINTERLKKLFGWAERITDPTDNKYTGFAKRFFAIRQFFSFCLLNTIHEDINNKTREDINPVLDFYTSFDRVSCLIRCGTLDLYSDLIDLIDNLNLNFYSALIRDLNLNPGLTPNRVFNVDVFLFLYLDFYFYMDPNAYACLPSEFADQFDEDLNKRIAFVERIGAEKTFKGVDLQRIVLRFKKQQKFIKAANKGEATEPLKESIHDTWLSVLKITNEMLAMSHEEMESYGRYFRAVELMIDCKEAAGRVSPEVWNGIEERFLTLDAVRVNKTRNTKSN